MEVRNFDHSLSGRDGNLVIFTEPSGIIELREGAFTPIAKKVFPIDGA